MSEGTGNLGGKEPSCSVLLVDVENCPSHLASLPFKIEHYSRIVLCYAQSGAKVSLDWMLALAPAIVSGKLSMVKMDKPGKNAADFGICFLAGSLMQELPKDTHFTIMSNDSDLDYTVQLLKKYGRSAERGMLEQDHKQFVGDEETRLEELVSLYCTELTTYKKNRPAKVDKLKNSIMFKLKDTHSLCEAVFDYLRSEGAIQVSGANVSYSDAKIKALLDKAGAS